MEQNYHGPAWRNILVNPEVVLEGDNPVEGSDDRRTFFRVKGLLCDT